MKKAPTSLFKIESKLLPCVCGNKNIIMFIDQIETSKFRWWKVICTPARGGCERCIEGFPVTKGIKNLADEAVRMWNGAMEAIATKWTQSKFVTLQSRR